MKTLLLDSTYKIIPLETMAQLHVEDDEAVEIQIVRHIKLLFHKAGQPYGDKSLRLVLPSVRAMAKVLGTSKHVILEAFKELADQDYEPYYADFQSAVLVENVLAREAFSVEEDFTSAFKKAS